MKDIFGLTTDNAGEPVAETIKAPSTSKLRQMFLHYTQNCDEHRSDAFRDRKYYDGDQISEAWRKSLADNETPMVTVNLIKDNIAAHVVWSRHSRRKSGPLLAHRLALRLLKPQQSLFAMPSIHRTLNKSFRKSRPSSSWRVSARF